MKNEVPSYTTEKEQRRLILSTRLALGVSRFSDEVVEYLMQNEHQDEIPQILDVAACLGRDQRFALLKAAEQGSLGSPFMTIPSEWAQAGEQFWKAEYDIKTDFAGLKIPPVPMNTRLPHILMLIHEKASQSPEFLYQSDKKAYDGEVWRFTDKSLDEVVPVHKPFASILTGTFGSWVADVQEAPDGCVGGTINFNTAAVDDIGWIIESLPMRQVHGRVHWRKHKIHLDQNVVTFCAGSRLSDGDVPGMYFCRDDGGVYINAGSPQYADPRVRFRRAVVRLPSNL